MERAGVKSRPDFGIGLGQQVLVVGVLQAREAVLEDGVGAVGVPEVVDGDVDHFQIGADFVRMVGGDFFIFSQGFFQLAFGAAGLGMPYIGWGLL